MSKKRRTFSPEFKAQVGLEALKGVEPVHVIAARHKVHPVQVSQWKKEVSERLPEVFGQKADRDAAEAILREKELFEEIGGIDIGRESEAVDDEAVAVEFQAVLKPGGRGFENGEAGVAGGGGQIVERFE